MDWKLKARLQDIASLLPSSISYTVYYWMQRRFGRLRQIDPTSRFRSAVEAWNRIRELGYEPCDKCFLEVGTGRVPCVPLAFWLMGARQTITLDLNTYLKRELTKLMLEYMLRNTDEMRSIFGSLLDRHRFRELLSVGADNDFSLKKVLALCNIRYVAPADATNTGLSSGSIDFHTSFRVFEHIPADVLVRIIGEGNRLVSENGLFVHRIDYGDHFAHTDPSITRINFLQYSDEKWEKYAGNRYMYMNRLRHDDFLELFQSAGHEILATTPDVDERSAELLRTNSFPLDQRFRSKPNSILSISGSWILSRKRA